MTYLDVGDVWSHRFTVKVGGTLTNATTSLTVTLPDGTTTSPTLTNSGTGLYDVAYTTTQVGWHRWVLTVSGAATGKDVGGFTVADPALAPLVSLDAAKAHLNMNGAIVTDDDELRRVLAVATDAAERYTNRALRRKTVTETHYTSPALLHQPPVLSVTSVLDEDTSAAQTVDRVDKAAGIVEWSGSADAVVVTYVAGYAAPPPVAVQAVLELTRHLWEQQQQTYRPGLGSPSEMDVYAPGASFSMPRRVAELLDLVRMGGFA